MIWAILALGLFGTAAKATAPKMEELIEKMEKGPYLEGPCSYVLYKDIWGNWSAKSKFPEK